MPHKQSQPVAWSTLAHADRMLSSVERVLLVGSGCAIILMMAITSVDVVMRYAVNSPLSWGFDLLTHYILPASFFLAFSYTLGQHGHVSVEFFSKKLDRRTYHAVIGAGFFLAFFLLGVIGVATTMDTYSAWAYDDVIAGAVLWPVWLSKAIVPLGMLPLALRTLYLAFAHWACVADPLAEDALGLGPIDELANEISP